MCSPGSPNPALRHANCISRDWQDQDAPLAVLACGVLGFAVDAALNFAIDFAAILRRTDQLPKRQGYPPAHHDAGSILPDKIS